MEQASIEVEGLYKIFGTNPKERALPLVEEGVSKADILARTGCTVGINNASFTIKKREIFVIMGLSGSGKSTVVRCLNRLIEPTSGSVKIDGEDITQLPGEQLREVRRRKLGMVFQRFGLLPHRSVIDNVGFGLEVQNVDEEERRKKALEAIKIVGLEGYEESMTQELSGGMQQRVGLARALANDPEILLMDEAFSALDPLIRVGLQDELLELQAKMHRTVVFITHDLDEALKLGDRIAIMKDGAVVQIGTAEEILTNPANDYVKAFVENVDRSRVITAGSIMKKTEAVAYASDGPHKVARQMRQLGLSTVLVVDSDRKFLGYVHIEDVVQKEKKVAEEGKSPDDASIKSLLRDDMFTASLDTPIMDMLTDAAKTNLPFAAIDENGVLKGIVTRPAILAGIAGD
ncbi:MAG: betaine/proline/choline family ABC transporter ATP-binding protein [Verrucomicrobia bacterium]|jgi:glycine betaine/proline transport system ATP-binding protein|nr:betaine/proline/choline family ABC transporter ATP-binding protein [Verrucomicrobiota bacterium]